MLSSTSQRRSALTFALLGVLCAGSGACDLLSPPEVSTISSGVRELDVEGITVAVSPGVVRAGVEQSADVRFSAGQGLITVETRPTSSNTLSLRLENIHREATVRIETIDAVATGRNNCPEPSGELEVFGVDCFIEPDNALCTQLIDSFEREKSTAGVLNLSVLPCAQIVLSVAPERFEPRDVSFLVVGAAAAPTTLSRIVEQERARGGDDAEHDFIVALGDQLGSDQADRIDELARVARGLDAVIVMVKGEQEADASEETQGFERAFGSATFQWTLHGAQFFTFDTSNSAFSSDQLRGMEGTLSSLRRQDTEWRMANTTRPNPNAIRGMPLMSFTYAPPYDATAFRENGFDSRLQGAQVMSMLAQYSTHALFAGKVLSEASVTDGRPRMWVTVAQNTRFKTDLASYLVVTISDTPSAGSWPAGQRHVRVTRRALTNL